MLTARFRNGSTRLNSTSLMLQLTTPVSEAAIRALKVGDEIAITGTLFTGRDAVHKYLHDGGQLPPGVNLKHTCHWLYKTMVMDANGRILPCCAAPNPAGELVFSTLTHARPDDCFNSERSEAR